MPRMIFVNLPVANLANATAFYEAIGFGKNAAFSDARASATVWSEAIHVMLLDHAFHATFDAPRIIDARTTSAVLLCLSFEDREAEWLDGPFSAGDLLMVSVLRRPGGAPLLEACPHPAAYVARGEVRPAPARALAAQKAARDTGPEEVAHAH